MPSTVTRLARCKEIRQHIKVFMLRASRKLDIMLNFPSFVSRERSRTMTTTTLRLGRNLLTTMLPTFTRALHTTKLTAMEFLMTTKMMRMRGCHTSGRQTQASLKGRKKANGGAGGYPLGHLVIWRPLKSQIPLHVSNYHFTQYKCRYTLCTI